MISRRYVLSSLVALVAGIFCPPMASAAIDKRRKISATIRKDGKLIASARV